MQEKIKLQIQESKRIIIRDKTLSPNAKLVYIGLSSLVDGGEELKSINLKDVAYLCGFEIYQLGLIRNALVELENVEIFSTIERTKIQDLNADYKFHFVIVVNLKPDEIENNIKNKNV